MPSWQSYVLNFTVRLQVKRKLAKARDAQAVRKAFGAALPAPRGASFSSGNVGGMAGEWAQAGGIAAGTLLYLHGGGYMACSPQTHRAITGSYANRGLKVFTPDYRLAPEHPFPAAVEDGLAAYKGLLESGIAPGALAVGGDSAGGGLALAVLLAARQAGLPMPSSCLVFSPWTDLAITGETIRTNQRRDSMLAGNTMADGAAFYLNGAEAKNPLASPLYGDFAGFPPLFITVGEAEVLRDDATRLAARAQAAGVKVSLTVADNMPHVWQLFQFMLPEARHAMDQAASFAKLHFIA
ncbi:MAG: alpha/beta hydrolase [Acidocella sp. 20-58-15]|nr:MAG: alpha/beta hydrolase [Acidocella sp. 20-58-15]